MADSKRKPPFVGQVKEVTPHPNADKLYTAKVKVDDTDPIEVIFGGNRVLQPGDLVPVALPGTRLPNGEKIRARRWRGIKSYGELLSSDELGWTIDGPDEVLVLSPETYHLGEVLRPKL